jgi:hypothetical protein
MTDAPKHPINPDPANELASDHSPIDPRDFRNALAPTLPVSPLSRRQPMESPMG